MLRPAPKNNPQFVKVDLQLIIDLWAGLTMPPCGRASLNRSGYEVCDFDYEEIEVDLPTGAASRW